MARAITEVREAWRRAAGTFHEVTGVMRIIAVTLLAAACGSSEPAKGAFDVDGIVTSSATTVRVAVHRRDVPLQELPMGRWLAGLPMAGTADLEIDLSAPIADGRHLGSKASGTIELRCREHCRLGDDRTKLVISDEWQFDFEHLTFDSIDIRAAVANGHATITKWQIASPDLRLDVSLDIALADDLAASTVDGCIRFAPTDALRDRAPRMHALIGTTGASLDDDGRFSIRLAGTLGHLKRLAQRCGPAAKTDR